MDQTPARVRHDVSLLTDDDLYLFNEGTPLRACTRSSARTP